MDFHENKSDFHWLWDILEIFDLSFQSHIQTIHIHMLINYQTSG